MKQGKLSFEALVLTDFKVCLSRIRIFKDMSEAVLTALNTGQERV